MKKPNARALGFLFFLSPKRELELESNAQIFRAILAGTTL